MASTFTPNLNLELQGTGDNPGTWGSVLNLAALTIVDNAMGGVQTLSLSSSNVTLTTTQSQNNAIKLTGALLADVDVTFPAIGRTYFVANNTTGAFDVTLKCAGGGTSAVIPQGRNGFIVLDGTNVLLETAQQAAPVSQVAAFASNSAPTGWLECDGSAVSRTTYAALYDRIGTTYGAGDGVTTFNLPDLRAYFIRGYDDGRGVDPARVFGSNQAGEVGPHTHTGTTGVDTPDHTHGVLYGGNGPNITGGITAVNGGNVGTYTTTGASVRHTHTFTTNANTGTETRPVNVAMLYCIKF